MTSKIVLLVLLVAGVTCQQDGDDDDGSYNPDKYEKPYENLIDETGEQSSSVPAQKPLDPSQNVFPQNVFFQRLQNAALQRQQSSVPQEIPQSLQQSFVGPLPAPVNRFLDESSLQSTDYQTDGHRRSEVVDDAGNVRGQYSYVDPDGKTITVRYSAGKDGFQAEGDHIPKAPQPTALDPTGLPQDANAALFGSQEARFGDSLPRQFFDRPRSQFRSFRPQFAAPSSDSFHRLSQLSFQPDGSYELQSKFQ